MRLRQLARADIRELVRLCEEAAAAHGKASWEGDYRTANRQYHVAVATYSELRRRGTEAQKAILPLLHHDDANVRVWAAVRALEFAQDEAVAVLESIAPLHGVAGLDAVMVLKQWHDGKLRIP